LTLGGADIELEGQPGEPFKFANVLWAEDEVGRTKRVDVGSSKFALVTWFGYGSNSVQIKSFEVSPPECMASYIESDVLGEPLGSVGYKLTLDYVADDETSVGQPTKYIVFTNSLGNSFVPSETSPFGFGTNQQYRFDLSELTKDTAIKFKAWKTNLINKEIIELNLPVSMSDDTYETLESDGYYGGGIVIGPILEDTEWITWEFSNGDKIYDDGYGRQFQVSTKCKFIEPSPTPTPFVSPTPSPTPTPYYYSGDNFSLLFKTSGSVNYQKFGTDIKCSSDGRNFILTSNPYKNGEYTTELSFFKMDDKNQFSKIKQVISSPTEDNLLINPTISNNGENLIIGNPDFIIATDQGTSNVETIAFAGSLTYYNYEQGVNRYVSKNRITSQNPSSFSRFGSVHKVSDNGELVVVNKIISGNNCFEILQKVGDSFQHNGTVVDSAFLGNASDSTADKLNSIFALSRNGTRLIVSIKGSNKLAIIDTSDGTAITEFSLEYNNTELVSLETDETASVILVRMEQEFLIYEKSNDTYSYIERKLVNDNSNFIGTEYKLSANGNKFLVSQPNWNENRGAVCLFNRHGSEPFTLFTKIENSNGQTGDKFGLSVDMSASGKLIFCASEFADVNSKTDTGRIAVFYSKYTHPDRIYVEVTDDQFNQMGNATGYYSFKEKSVVHENIVDDSSNNEFEYYQHESNSTWRLILDMKVLNSNSGKMDTQHKLYGTLDLPYSYSPTVEVYSEDPLLSNWNNIRVMLASEVTPTPTPVPEPTPTPTPDLNPSTIYVTNISAASGTTDINGEYTKKPPMYFSSLIDTVPYYENAQGWKILIAHPPNSMSHSLVNPSGNFIGASQDTNPVLQSDWGGLIVVCESLPCESPTPTPLAPCSETHSDKNGFRVVYTGYSGAGHPAYSALDGFYIFDEVEETNGVKSVKYTMINELGEFVTTYNLFHNFYSSNGQVLQGWGLFSSGYPASSRTPECFSATKLNSFDANFKVYWCSADGSEEETPYNNFGNLCT
jgi:hypothetical protein